MSDSGGAGSILQAVSESPAATASVSEGTGSGLTPPRRRTGPSHLIADVIVDLGYVERERAEAAVEESRRLGKRMGQVLVDAGALSPEQLARAPAGRGR